MRRFALTLSVVAMAFAWANPASAQVLLEARAGIGVPLHGDMVDDLDLDIGAGFGIKGAYEASEFLALDFRFDAMWLFGQISGEAETPFGEFEGEGDTSASVYAISVGPTLTFGLETIDIYFGAHPGIYFSSWDIEGSVESRGGGIRVSGEAESDTSVDFGFNTQVGVRFYLTERLVLGPEIAYHFILLRDEVEDESGGLLASVVLGYRY